MARIRMVTRTIKTTLATVLCVNIETGESFKKDVTLAGIFKDEKSISKAIESIITEPNVKFVHVIDTSVEEALYGLAENEFVSMAKKLTKA